jgi:WD40 repeat protein
MTPDCEAAVTINLRDKKYGCNRWHVKSVCLNKDGRKVLIGTNGSEVFEISATEEAVDLNGGCLVTGHCRKSLRGIAAHPMQPEYCTVGEDRTIRLWSAGAKKLSRMLSLSGEARSCCYSPDGYLVAVGMADGSVQVVSLLKPQLDVVKELKVEGAAGPVTGVRFSPSGKVLACATDAGPDGSRVVFYDCENTATPGGAFTLKSKFVLAAVTDAANKAASSGANAAANGLVTPPPFELSSPAAMDFSGDSSTLQLATSFGVVYVTVDSGACVGMAAASSLSVQRSGAGLPAPSVEEACQAVLRQGATQYRDETWASYTLPSGWAARGVYRPGAQGGDVVSVCRGTSGGGNLACAADAFGCLSLVSWPCPSSSEVNDDSGGGERDAGEGGFTASLSADGSSGLEAATSNNNIAVGGGGGEAPKRQYWGHGAAMGGACFVVGDTHVVSIGADDRCVFQWATGKPSVEALAKLQVEEAKAKELAAKMEAAAKAKAEQDDDLDWEAAEAAEKKKKLAEEEALTASDDAATDPEVVVSLAAKPPQFTSNAQPPDLAKLSFVQGLSTLRGGAFVNADGHVLHCAGSLGVVYVKKRHAQLVFSGHHDNLDHNGNGGGAPIVRVLACQADVGFRFGACAASGDASGGVCVWDACTAASRSSLPQGLHTGSEISALGFSNSSHRLGSFLVSVGSDQRHTLGVWQSPKQDWTDPVLVCSAQVGGGLVSFCAWAASSGSAHSGGRKGRAAPQEQYDFCVGGAAKGKGSSSNSSGVQFWSLSCGNAKCVSGTYAEGVVEEDLNVCGVGLGKSPAEGMGHLQLMATGGASGRILLWEGTTCVRVSAKAHASAVTDLKVAPLDVSPRKPKDAAPGRYKGRMGLVSGGLDGVVKVWAVSGVGGDATLALSSAFDVSNECVPRPLRSSVCAVAVDGPFTKMLVVTESSELLEVVRDSRATVQLLAAHAPALTDGTGPEEGPAAHTGGGNGGGGVSGGVARGVVDPVAPHPSEPDLLASGGSDGTVRVWSRSGRCGLAVLEVGNPVAAVCWVPDPPDAASTGACGGLLVSLAPSGSLVQISVDLGTMVLAKAKVVSPSQTPVPHALMVDTEGKMIKAFASPKDKQPTFLEMSNGKPLAEVSAAAKSTWYGDSKAGESSSSSGGSDADGACLFMY